MLYNITNCISKTIITFSLYIKGITGIVFIKICAKPHLARIATYILSLNSFWSKHSLYEDI